MFYSYDTNSGRPSFTLAQGVEKRSVNAPRLPVVDTETMSISPHSDHPYSRLGPSSRASFSPSHSDISETEIDDVHSYYYQHSDMETSWQGGYGWEETGVAGDGLSNNDDQHWDFASPKKPTSYTYSNAMCGITESSPTQSHHLSTSYLQVTPSTQLVKNSYIHTPLHMTPPTPELCNTLPQSTPFRVQPPLQIHQPRPSRRIPIVSLSQLASACEDDAILQRIPKPVQKPRTPRDRVNITSNSYMFPPFSDIFIYEKPVSIPVTNSGSSMSRVLQCACGCMETYTIG